MSIKSTLIALVFAASLSAQFTISVSNTTLQSGVKGVGVNLGGETFFDSLQILKNLTVRNPGFNPTMMHSVVPCSSGSTTSCTVSGGTWGGTGGYWPYGTPISVISGAASGCNTTATWNGSVFSFLSACSGAIANGDYIIVGPATFANSATMLANGWPANVGSGSITSETSDVPPSLSTSTQAAQMTAPTSGDTAIYQFKFDSTAGRSFVKLNGTYQISFWAKGVSGTKQLSVEFDRNAGGIVYLSPQTFNLTSSWAQYSTTFTASETSFPCTSGATCVAQTVFSTVGADTIYLDDVQTTQCSTSTTGGCVTDAANPTVFRDEVVTALKALQPGSIRMWDGVGLGNTLDNMLVDQFGRMPTNSNSYLTTYSYDDITYSIPDFLQLVQTVGGNTEAWIVVPITFTTTEASNLIDYLSGGSGTTYGAKRIAEGFTTPWTSVIPKIHLEFGNEAWNNTNFAGGDIQNGAVYGARADAIFAAMKANSNYVSGSMDLVLGAQVAIANTLQTIQNACSHNDSIDVGPYMMNSNNDASSTLNIWGPTMVEPQAFYYGSGTTNNGVTAEGISSGYFTGPSGTTTYYGGEMYLDQLAEAYSSHPKPMVVYEEQMGTGQGSGANYTQSQMDSYVTAWGAGLATAEEELLNMQNGVLTQNVFQLGQYNVSLAGVQPKEWGIVVDMGGTTNLKRPQFLAAQAINAAIPYGGTMLTTTQSCSSACPTYSQGGPINTVTMPNAQVVQSFAFHGSSGYSLILLNTDLSTSHAVTFSGANAPTGSVTLTTLTSANLTNTNESSAVIAPSTSTLSSPTGMTLSPYSMYVLTWGGSPAPAVSLSASSLTFPSTTVGSSAPTQTVTLTNNGSASLSITGISITGDYSQTNTCGTLPATIPYSGGNTCVFTVTFTPTASGTRTGTLTITDSASGSPHQVTLSGTGATSGPATYYVSNTGSDSANGTSSSTPWQTIAKVNAATLVAGSSVLFQAGGTWREQLTLTASGTSGNPITIGSYGTGARPIIDGASLASWTNTSGNIWRTAASTNPLFPNFAGTPGVLVASQSALTAANEWYWDGSAYLYVYATSSPASTVEIPTRTDAINANCQSFITVSGLELRGAASYGYQNWCASNVSHNVLSGLLVDLNYSNGVSFLSSANSAVASANTLTASTLQNDGSSGIKQGAAVGTTGDWNSWTISGNTVTNNCLWPVSSGGGADNQFCGGIYVFGAIQSSGGSSVISGNTVTNNGTNAPASYASDTNIGNGIWSDTDTGVLIENNVVHGNIGIGVYLEKTVNNVEYQDLSYNNASATGGTFFGNGTMAAGQGYNSTGNLVLECTFAGTGYAEYVMNFETTSGIQMSGNTLQDNLFIPNGGNWALVTSAQVNQSGYYSNLNVLKNNGFGVQASNFLYTQSTAFSTYSAFETAWCGSAGCTLSLQSDPLFVAPGSGNYNLQANSPARAFGAVYSGYPPICGGTLVDLGALPYACSSLTVTPSAVKIVATGTVTLTASQSVTWSITSQSAALGGNASLSSTSGTSTTLSLASGTYYAGQPIVVTATPASGSPVSMTIYSTGGAYVLQMHR